MRAVASSAVNTKFSISTAGVLCYSHSACFLRSLVAYFQLWYGLLMSFLHDRCISSLEAIMVKWGNYVLDQHVFVFVI